MNSTVSYKIRLKYEDQEERVKFYIGKSVSFSNIVTVIELPELPESESETEVLYYAVCNLFRKDRVQRRKKMNIN